MATVVGNVNVFREQTTTCKKLNYRYDFLVVWKKVENWLLSKSILVQFEREKNVYDHSDDTHCIEIRTQTVDFVIIPIMRQRYVIIIFFYL